MLRSLLLLCGLAFLCASGCNSTKSATESTPTSTAKSTSAPANRGDRTDRRAEADQRLTETIARLGLDETQATKFREITQRFAEQGRQLRQSSGGDRQASRTASQEMRQKMDAEINTLLNKDQQAIYATIKKEQQEEMRSQRGGGGGRPGGGRPGGGK